MAYKFKFIPFLLGGLLLQACAKENYLSAEPLATGGYLARASVSTWRGSKGAAIARIKEDAVVFCRREGREAIIKEIKTSFDTNFSIETAQAEFDCAPITAKSGTKN